MPELEEGSFSFEDETEEETTVEGQETDEGTDEGQDQQINNQGEGQDQGENQGQDQQQTITTDKGTKLADDPLSQANQLRANAERKLKLAMDYIAEMEAKVNGNQQQGKEEELFLDPSKIETTEDLQKFAGSLIKLVEQKQSQLDGQLKQTAQEREAERTKTVIMSQIEQVQSKFPMFRELNADGTPNPLYDAELDKALADIYNELDFDDKSQSYRGKVSLFRLAETIAKTSKRGEVSGSQKAQTTVIDKRLGMVKANGAKSTSEPDTSKMSASSIIASRIAQGAKARR